MTKKSEPEDLLLQTFGQTLPMQSDQRMQLDAEATEGNATPEEASQPSRPSMTGASLQILQQFVADAQAKGPQQPRSSQVPMPDWQTDRTGLPVSRLSPEKTSED